MYVLVSNDDGIDAHGIQVLARHLEALGRVTVVAPDRDRSGSSHALTLSHPIRVSCAREGHYRVTGTPADCVHLALFGLLEEQPDIVVSGINNSSNLGDDVIYSGTVSAAMEGRYCGLPAVAVSLVTADHRGTHYDTAARAALLIIERLVTDPLPADTILNINVPDRPWDEIRGFEVTRLGLRGRSGTCIQEHDPRGKPLWWIGPAGVAEDDGPGTDFDAIRRGYVSVTPLHADLTRFRALEKVSHWAQALSAAKQPLGTLA